MSTRPLIKPQPVITNGNMATALTSQVTVLTNSTVVSYTYSWSGSAPVGAINVQVSNDYAINVDGSVKNAGNWETLPLSTSPVTSGNTGSGAIDIDITGFYAMRTTYTPSTGTGLLQATVVTKVS